MARILGREGAGPKVSRMFYIAVKQQVLLFGAESWVLTGKMEAALDAFQGRVARRLTVRIPRRGRDGKWKYLPLAGAIKDAGIVRVSTQSSGDRIRSRNLLQRSRFWPSVRARNDGGGHGSPKDGGSRRE